jgi:hypothetical protein
MLLFSGAADADTAATLATVAAAVAITTTTTTYSCPQTTPEYELIRNGVQHDEEADENRVSCNDRHPPQTSTNPYYNFKSVLDVQPH